jgi:hypothetical protein
VTAVALASPAAADRPVSRAALWSGRALAAPAVLLLLFSAAVKLLRAPEALASFGGMNLVAPLEM